MTELFISRELLDDIVSHCKEEFPNEACGILAGKEGMVEKIYRMTNIKNSPVNYEMDSMEQFRCMKEMRAKGLKLIGIYHSHPSSSAYPSRDDVEKAYWPDLPDTPVYPEACYMIVSLVDKKPEVRTFIIGPEKIDEIKLSLPGEKGKR
ncbi:MAG: M67 family metallopeptidase [Nitrospirae bacterium]|nr:M67 family metallopeptidase [Nitrospirota bacterium]